MIKNRLYVITGKGGVGKTTIAQAMAKSIQSHHNKICYIYLEDQNQRSFLEKHNIAWAHLELFQSSEDYVAKKLNNKAIAKWVCSTKFFRSLIQMVPGFSYLIFLGDILDRLNSDPHLTVILDSPASGHTLTMFEAANNFKKIFRSGQLVDDINKMMDFVYTQNIIKLIIAALPSAMAANEAKELNEALKRQGVENSQLIFNNCLCKIEDIDDHLAPPFLNKKIQLEKNVLQDNVGPFSLSIPHYFNEQTSPSEDLAKSQIVEALWE